MWWAIQRRLIWWDFLRRIRKHGWTGTYVPPDGDDAEFAYSIGFWEAVGAPEIIMFGFQVEVANGLLGEACRQLKTGELKPADKTRWELEWEGAPPLVWREVHPSQIRREHFNVAIMYREHRRERRDGLRAVQLFAPDRNGIFPWEDGYDTDYRPRQKELYLPYPGPATLV